MLSNTTNTTKIKYYKGIIKIKYYKTRFYYSRFSFKKGEEKLLQTYNRAFVFNFSAFFVVFII
jgi:hypothetical protein